MLMIPAAASADPIKIYLLKSTAWSAYNLYAWNNAKKELNGGWPGTRMTATEKIDDAEYYVWTAPENETTINIIFNNGSQQTGDITGITSTRYYRHNGSTNFTTFNPLVLGNPSISQNGNTITIRPSADGGNVYYTTDGTEPGKESAVYTEPFTLDADATVKAIQMKETARSEVVSLDFTWAYYTDLTVEAGLYYISTEGDVPEICSTDLPYIPAEGQPKVSGQPAALYIMGNLLDSEGNKHHWQTNYKVEGKCYGSCFVFENVTLGLVDNDPNAYFTFVTAIGSTGNSNEWDNIINKKDRFGANSKDAPISEDNAVNLTKFNGGGNASSANSWKIAAGTYTFIVDFRTNKVTATRKGAPEFAAMTPAATENMKASAGTLYSAITTGANNAIRCGEVIVTGIAAGGEGAYIVRNGKAESVSPVAVGLFDTENNLLSDQTRLVASAGTDAARYSAGDVTGVLADGEITLRPEDFGENTIVNINWEADNTQGLTFTGNFALVNATTSVTIYAVVPRTWSGIHYSITSSVNPELNAEGDFTETEGKYLVLNVPSHLIHSTVVLSNTTPGIIALADAADADNEDTGNVIPDSFTYPLTGKSVYFDRDGAHWLELPYDPSGIESEVYVEDEPVEYYNLQGIKVVNPSNGLFIRRCGNKVNKISMN